MAKNTSNQITIEIEGGQSLTFKHLSDLINKIIDKEEAGELNRGEEVQVTFKTNVKDSARLEATISPDAIKKIFTLIKDGDALLNQTPSDIEKLCNDNKLQFISIVTPTVLVQSKKGDIVNKEEIAPPTIAKSTRRFSNNNIILSPAVVGVFNKPYVFEKTSEKKNPKVKKQSLKVQQENKQPKLRPQKVIKEGIKSYTPVQAIKSASSITKTGISEGKSVIKGDTSFLKAASNLRKATIKELPKIVKSTPAGMLAIGAQKISKTNPENIKEAGKQIPGQVKTVMEQIKTAPPKKIASALQRKIKKPSKSNEK